MSAMPPPATRVDDLLVQKRAKLFFGTTLSEKLLLLAIVLSPFQKAFTIDLGFPLKASEIAIILAIGTWVFSRRKTEAKSKIRLEKTMVGTIAGIALVSTAYNLLLPVPVGNDSGYGGDPTRDMVTYLAYALMVLIAWSAFTGLSSEKMARALGVALRLCVLACIFQYVLWLAGDIAALRLFRYELVTGSAYGISSPRNGPFMEGNYLGFFGGIGLFIAAKYRDKVGIFCALFCVLFSQSTNALLAVVVAALATALIRPSVRWQSVVGFAAMAFGAAALLVPQLQRFVTFQLGKLGVSDGGYGASEVSQSITVRSDKSEWAFRMALDNFVLGVGPGRFGLHFDEYSTRAMDAYSGRALVESAYGQLAAELGLIAFLAIIVLLASLAVKSLRRSAADFATVVFVAVALSAAPSWTTITIWIAFAYLASAAKEEPVRITPDIRVAAVNRSQASFGSRPVTRVGSIGARR